MTANSPSPTLSADDLLAQLQTQFHKLCQDVTDAVNAAPDGAVINGSERQVHDLLARFREATFQAAIQLRSDAATAAFSPSASS